MQRGTYGRCRGRVPLPLIGVGLLEDRVLTIDYPQRTVTVR